MTLKENKSLVSSRIKDFLCSANAYSHDTHNIQCLETHISWIFLTGEFAYKVKKPVTLGFVDFSTLTLRKHFCEEELRLNRRFAPKIYLEVVTINQVNDVLTVNGNGPIVDFAVKMRQFSQAALLSNLCNQNRLSDDIIDQMAEKIAHFHLSLNAIEPLSDSIESVKHSVFSNLEEIQELEYLARESDQLRRIESNTHTQFSKLIPILKERQKGGFIRDCHGDLHLGNIANIGGEVTLFDCIEFNEEFRYIDVICDIAFTLMDLDFRQRTTQANRLLNQYLELTGDYNGLHLLRFYQIYLALVRAKVHLIQANQSQSPPSSRSELYHKFKSYLDLAESYFDSSLPVMILMSGLSGSGKSTIAAQLAYHSGAIRIRSDVERKRLYNLSALDSSSKMTHIDIYSEAATEDTFAHLQTLVTAIVHAGYSCIVDATFIRQPQRDDFIQLANKLECPIHILYCYAEQATLERRIRQRALSQRDASEADISVLYSQIQSQDPFTQEERQHLHQIDSEKELDLPHLINLLGMEQDPKQHMER